MRERTQWLFVIAAIAATTSIAIFASQQSLRGQASVIQDGQSVTAGGNDLGNQISGLTQGIINKANQGVGNTLENLQSQATPQLAANASSYSCIVVIMHFGKASGAMTCGTDDTTSLSVNSANAPGGVSSSIQSSQSGGNSATSMQNSMTGSGSEANVFQGN